MKLLSIYCEGLPGYQSFHFDDLKKVNVLVGPNGTGKTTALRVLQFALHILSRKTFKANFSSQLPAWDRFSRATLIFGVTDDEVPDPFFSPKRSDKLELTIVCSESVYMIESITYGDHIKFSTTSTIETINDLVDAMEHQRKELENLKKRLAGLSDSNNRQQTKNAITEHSETLENLKHQLEQATLVELSLADTKSTLQRTTVDSHLEKLNFPEVFFVDPTKAIEKAIPELINNLCTLKSGRTIHNKQFNQAKSDLQFLLQHSVDFFEEGDNKQLTVNGIDYRHASTGTQVSLAYFGLTNALSDAAIVIWDEPENGLHPTRRIRILDLIKNDKRTFFLATHALEFAPLFYDEGRVFRCDAEYVEDAAAPTLSINPISTRGDAFRLLEALGVQPARTLFTANVIVWVEGPTELIFYRHWLTQYFADHHPDIEEGFHYTIMHYGGGLISYLEVSDDQDQERTSVLYDLLSLCRHPVIIVDSDFRIKPESGQELTSLKPSARKIHEQVGRLNSERVGAALFCYTDGREVENYFPDEAIWHAVTQCWKGCSKHTAEITAEPFKMTRYEAFHEAIETYLITHGIIDQANAGTENSKPAALGRTQWGASNKVEMTRMALTYKDLTIDSMRWEFANKLKTIASFIIKHAQTGDGV